MRSALRGRVDDVDDLRLAEVAETEPEVQRCADDGDDIGSAQGGSAGLGEGERVRGREAASPHAVGEDGHVQRLRGLTQGCHGITGVDIRSRDDDGTLGAGEQHSGPGYVLRVGLDDRYAGVGR